MKKLLLLMVSTLTFNAIASKPGDKEAAEAMKPWSEAATKNLVDGLAWSLEEGAVIPDFENNGVYKVCLSMQERLKTTQPHQFPAAALAMTFLKAITSNSKYNEALILAKQKHIEVLSSADEKIKAESEKIWRAFRKAAASALTDIVEQRSAEQARKYNATSAGKMVKPFTFNREPENIKEIFIQNPVLAPHDVENLEAANLSLFGLSDVQERTKNALQQAVK